jgi:hypothetical protein
VNSNVGIDFTDLGPPRGRNPGGYDTSLLKGVVGEKREDLITIVFRVKPKEKATIQVYVNRMYNQFVVDPNTKEPKRMVDYHSSELVTKLVTFSYMTQFNWFLLAGTFLFRNHHLI